MEHIEIQSSAKALSNLSNLAANRLPLFPVTTHLQGNEGDKRLSIAACDLGALAEQYGTPLYLYDQATMEAALSQYHQSLSKYYPGSYGLTYASKAFLCIAIAQWVVRHGLILDCTGAGELAIAVAAGVPTDKILVHGVNKSFSDLYAALNQAGTLVIDNLSELNRLAPLLRKQPHCLKELWLRLRPGLAVDTHGYTQTGQLDSKFGMNDSEFLQAVQTCLQENLPLTGLHFHQGSHFHDPQPIAPALDTALDLVQQAYERFGWLPRVICPGGGWGVAYHEVELPHPPIENYVHFIAKALIAGCKKRGLPLPHLQLEPGRSLVAQAGVAIYRLDTVKKSANRRWLLLDGGLADNPRPALYGARYSALPVYRPDRPALDGAWLAGPYCESGDVLIEDLPMPEVQTGELIAIPVSGAYQLSMSSNYNGARKPAVLWLHEGQASLIQRRETVDDLFRRDLPLPQDTHFDSKKMV